jgi:hypothetical protein
MFGAQAVDLVVGMLFIFLVFSLVVSGINEGIARILSSRSRQLWRSLKELLDGSAGKGDQRPQRDVQVDAKSPLSLQLYSHPMIQQLETAVRDKRSRLSRIPSTDFARGLIDVVVPGDTVTVEDFEKAIKQLPNGLEAPLRAVAKEVGNDVEKLRRGIGEWFDARMTSLSAAYRRRTKWALFAIGLVVAAVLNVDAIDAAQRLYRDEVLRTAVAEQAVNVASQCQDQQDVEMCTRNAVSDLDGAVHLPVGWTDRTLSDIEGSQVVGWLLAGIALSQGAPFWYDLLRKATGVRK